MSADKLARAALIGAVVAVVLKGLILFVAIPALSSASPADYQVERFPDRYDLIAQNLIDGHGYRVYPDTTLTMMRTPGFVLVLAGIFKLFGHSLVATQAFNLLFSVVGAGFVYLLATQLGGDRRLGLLAAAISFFHPAALLAESRGGLESFLSMSITGTMLLVYRAIRTEALRDYIIAGLVFGAVLLVKSTVALFPVLLFLALWARRRSVAGFFGAAGRVTVFGVAAVLVVTPWIIRNYELSHAFVPTMTNGGPTAYQGLYVVKHWGNGEEHFELLNDATHEQEQLARDMHLKFRSDFFQHFYSPADELSFSRRLGDSTTHELLDNPRLLLHSMVFNLSGFWFQGRTAKATLLNEILVLPFLALFAVGCVVAYRRRIEVGPILLFTAGFVAAHLPILGVARYHVPLIPLMSVVASLAALTLFSYWDQRPSRS